MVEVGSLSELDLTDEELIGIAMEQLGLTRDMATLMLAIERGEVEGDVVGLGSGEVGSREVGN